MGSLGSIFEAEDRGQPRGPDIRVSVDVPRHELGREQGFDAPVPTYVARGGRRIRRAGESESIRLHLPREFPDRAVIRLRGEGGVRPEGRPGDLFVEVRVVDPPTSPDARVAIVVAAVLILGATASWFFL